MGNCRSSGRLSPGGFPEAAGESSIRKEDQPRPKSAWSGGPTARHSSLFASFSLAKWNPSRANSILGNQQISVEQGYGNGNTVLLVSPANLEQLQSLIDSAEEGTCLNLQGQTVSEDDIKLAEGLTLSKRITLCNGRLCLPPTTSVEAATAGCTVTLRSLTITSQNGKAPVLVVRKGAAMRLEDCSVSGSTHDAVQVRGTGSTLEAMGCQLSSLGEGAGLCVILGGAASCTDCSFEGLVGLEAADAGTQVTARHCSVEGVHGTMENGVVVSAGASAKLDGCTILMEECCGLHASGEGTRVTAKSCGISKCGKSNVAVHNGAFLVLEDSTCSSSSEKCGLEAYGAGTRLHAVNVVACHNQEHNAHVAAGAHAAFVGCTLDSAGVYGLLFESHAVAHLFGCCISDAGMKNVVVSGGADTTFQKCRTYGRRVYGVASKDPRQKWGWVAVGACRLSAVDCYWSPVAPPTQDTNVAPSRPSQLFPGWMR